MNESMKRIWTALLTAALALLLAGCGAEAPVEPTPDPQAQLAEASKAAERILSAVNETGPAEPETENGRLLAALLREPRRYEARGALRLDGESAALTLALLTPDADALRAPLAEAMQAALASK